MEQRKSKRNSQSFQNNSQIQVQLNLDQQKKLAEIKAYIDNIQHLIQENKDYEEKLKKALEKIDSQVEKINNQKCMKSELTQTLKSHQNQQNNQNQQQQNQYKSQFRYQSLQNYENKAKQEINENSEETLQFRNNNQVFQLFGGQQGEVQKFSQEQMIQNQKKHCIQNVTFYRYESRFQSTATAQVLEMAKNPKQKSRLIEIYKGIQNAQNFQDENYLNSGKINDYIYDEYNNMYENDVVENNSDLDENFIRNCLLQNRDWLRDIEDQKQLNQIFQSNQSKKDDIKGYKSFTKNKGVLDETQSNLNDDQQGQNQFNNYCEYPLENNKSLIFDNMDIQNSYYSNGSVNLSYQHYEKMKSQLIYKIINNIKYFQPQNINFIKIAYSFNIQLIKRGLIRIQITGLDLFKQYLEANNMRPKQIEWTQEEDQKLVELVQVYGEKHWGQISNHFDGRFFSDVSQRWLKYLNKNLKKGRWNLRDDLKLAILVELYSDNQNNIQWSKIIKFFDNRTDVQVRERWCNLLNPNLKILVWTAQEDQKLIQLTQKYDGKWAKIAKQLDSKTDNQCLRKWKFLVSKKYNRLKLINLDINYHLENKMPIFQCVRIGRLRDFVEKDLQKRQSVKMGDRREKIEYLEEDKDNGINQNNNNNQSNLNQLQNDENGGQILQLQEQKEEGLKKRGRKPKIQCLQQQNIESKEEQQKKCQNSAQKKRGRKKKIVKEEDFPNQQEECKIDQFDQDSCIQFEKNKGNKKVKINQE